MKLIVTEKDSAARKIAEILGGRVSVQEHGRGKKKNRSYGFEWDGAPATAIGLRGHVMESVFPNTYRRWSLKYLEAHDPRTRARLGGRRRRRRHAGRAARGGQGRDRARDRHRLRPRGRAHRPRGPRDPARRRPQAEPRRPAREEEAQGGGQGRRRGAVPRARRPGRAARQGHAAVRRRRPARARALLGAHPRRGQGGVRQADDGRLQPRRGGSLPSGHRPHLGRRPHALHVAGVLPLRLRLPLGGPRPVAHPAPDRRPRARAPRLRPGPVLGDQGDRGARRRVLRGGAREGPLRRARRRWRRRWREPRSRRPR